MIPSNYDEKLKAMSVGGKISAKALNSVLKNVRAGISTLELDEIAHKIITDAGGKPSFKTVEDYRFTTCININEGLVHGLPGDRIIKKGDLVSVDLGTIYNGYHTDLSFTIEAETNTQSKFLNVGKKALRDGIKKCVLGNRVGDISYAIQKVVEGAGYSVSRDLVGHGIGKKLHESPYVPCYGKKGRGSKLFEGMTLAVEVIYQKGKPEIALADDDWTVVTADKSLSGLFEHTVFITRSNFLILTE